MGRKSMEMTIRSLLIRQTGVKAVWNNLGHDTRTHYIRLLLQHMASVPEHQRPSRDRWTSPACARRQPFQAYQMLLEVRGELYMAHQSLDLEMSASNEDDTPWESISNVNIGATPRWLVDVLDMPEEVTCMCRCQVHLQCPDSCNFLALILGLRGLEDAS